MRKRIEELIRECGVKHWSFGLRRHPELLEWINQQTTDLGSSTTLAERVHCALTNTRAPCSRGNLRKFKSIVDGWTFCGKTGKCECAREQVSQSVREAKQSDTVEKRVMVQAKREATNIDRYGHVNSAQTIEARAAHRAFYANADNVRNQLRKQIATMMERYGVENAAHIGDMAEKRQATMLERFGVTNPMQHADIAARSITTRLANGYSEDYYRRNYDRLKARLLTDYATELLTPFEDYSGSVNRPRLNLRCIGCRRHITWRLSHHAPRCQVCNPYDTSHKSKEELAVYQFIKDKMSIHDLISGDRQLILPYEIDILSERHRVAIEYCGLYWHSELQQPDHNYHLTKLRAVEGKGYRLFTVFSDEWQSHPDIVKSKICYLFNRIEDRRFARKLAIVEINATDAISFYEHSHIQGATNANHHLALLDDGQIVAAMSFIKARDSKGLPDGSYELVRFASLPYIAVVGGASRLFRHFIKLWQPVAVVSYADRRWSDGGLYHQLGFTLEHENPPSYSYVEHYMKRHFRFNFRKDVLIQMLGQIDGTEWEIMQNLGYDRIWDCGTYRFVWRR